MIKLRLKDLIEEENLEPKDIKDMLGLCDDSNVYHWLVGAGMPNLTNIIKLADYFKCSVEYLLGRTEDNSQMDFKKCPPFDVQLKKVMKERDKTQYKMIYIDKLCNPSHFHKWLKEKSIPAICTVVKLADYLNVSVDYLLGRE